MENIGPCHIIINFMAAILDLCSKDFQSIIFVDIPSLKCTKNLFGLQTIFYGK